MYQVDYDNNFLDPTLPPELLLLVQAALCPAVAPEVEETGISNVKMEFEFPPWPEGLPPPPPFPAEDLPGNYICFATIKCVTTQLYNVCYTLDGWKMNVDDEGRCYYYDVVTRQSQWDPPAPFVEKKAEDTGSGSSVTSGSEEEPDAVEEGVPTIAKVPIQTLRSRLMDRAERRKKSGLVQERLISVS